MRLPDDLKLEFPSKTEVSFKTACNSVSGRALWQNFGYNESSYTVTALDIVPATEHAVLEPSMEMASLSPGHFNVVGNVVENQGWFVIVAAFGFTFDIYYNDFEKFGFSALLLEPDEEDVIRVRPGVLPVGAWVRLEIKNLTF